MYKRLLSTAAGALPPKRQATPWGLYLATFVSGATVAQFVGFSDLMSLYSDPSAEQLERKLSALPVYQKYANDPSWKMSRGWNFSETNAVSLESKHLTAQTLAVPGAFSVEPVVFTNAGEQSTVAIYHVGMKLAGYPFMIHGGILATILDESLKRCAGVVLCPGEYHDERINTEALTLQYKFPTIANNFIVVENKVTHSEGRKCIVECDVLNSSGRLLVKGDGEFALKERKWSLFK